MKMKTFAAVAAAVLVSGMAAKADHMSWNWNDRFHYDRENMERFTANELTFDLYGSYLHGEKKLANVLTTNIRSGRWGGGLGANYFFHKNLGVGLDINAADNRGNFLDSANASFIARFPIDPAGVAPYVFAGGGRQFDPAWVWTAHVGGGVEFRLNHNTGFFSDARYVFSEKRQSVPDYLLLRAGIRLAF